MAAGDTTGSTGLSVEMKTYYDRVLLERALPSLVHANFGQVRPLPRNGGKIIEFRKFTALDANTTALTEGSAPTGKNLAATNATATVAQYGNR